MILRLLVVTGAIVTLIATAVAIAPSEPVPATPVGLAQAEAGAFTVRVLAVAEEPESGRKVPTATRTVTPTVTPTATPTATSTPDPGRAGREVWVTDLLDRINSARVRHDLAPLALHPQLMQAAQAHADDCSARGSCSHEGSDGSNLYARLQRAGYDPIRFYGENWAWFRDPTGAFDFWYNEPPGADPHRRNLLSDHFTHIGIGIAPADHGGWYFITDFGSQ